MTSLKKLIKDLSKFTRFFVNRAPGHGSQNVITTDTIQ